MSSNDVGRYIEEVDANCIGSAIQMFAYDAAIWISEHTKNYFNIIKYKSELIDEQFLKMPGLSCVWCGSIIPDDCNDLIELLIVQIE